MSGKSAQFSAEVLALILNGTAISGIAQNNASSPLTQFYISLHTADPLADAAETGTAATSEATYTGYARKAHPRGTFVISTDSSGYGVAQFPANLDFDQATGGLNNITHWSVTTDSSGASKILYSGTVTPNIGVVNGVIPRLTSSTKVRET